MKKTGAVLVAAGRSSRMGDFKPILPFGDSTIALHIVNMLNRLGVSPVVVVTGYRADELEAHLSHAGVRFVRNERFGETQMFDSVRLGIEAVAADCDRIMVMPMDIPAIMPDTIRQVLMIDAGIVRTMCGGEPGHPIMFQSSIGLSLCSYQGEKGLRGAIESAGVSVTDLEVEDEGIYRDVDTKDDYEELIQWNYRRGRGHPISPLVQVRLKAGDVFFGPGTGQLLSMIRQSGSIQEACLRTGLSYSKGSRMIKEVERQLGMPVVERRAGGMGGGGSSLTEEGRRLLENYERMVTEVRQCTEQIFRKYFEKGIC